MNKQESQLTHEKPDESWINKNDLARLVFDLRKFRDGYSFFKLANNYSSLFRSFYNYSSDCSSDFLEPSSLTLNWNVSPDKTLIDLSRVFKSLCDVRFFKNDSYPINRLNHLEGILSSVEKDSYQYHEIFLELEEHKSYISKMFYIQDNEHVYVDEFRRLLKSFRHIQKKKSLTELLSISDDSLDELYLKVKPVVRVDGVLHYIEKPDLRNVGYTWDPKIISKANDLVFHKSIETYHDMELLGYFKPSVAEVLVQIHKKTLNYISAFEIPVSDNDPDPKSVDGLWLAKINLYR